MGAWKLKKPPISEAWIQASTTSSAEADWSWDGVHHFLQSFGEDLDVFETLPSFTPEAKKFDSLQAIAEIEVRVEPRYLRVRNKNRSRVIQVARNELLVASLRQSDSEYPGFKSLLDRFLQALDKYKEFVSIAEVANVQTHYVDIINIPDMYDEKTDIGDLFFGGPQLPDPKQGTLLNVEWTTTFRLTTVPVVVQQSVRMEPPEDFNGRFRLDWHCWHPGLETKSNEQIAKGLAESHNEVLECFKNSFKPRVWNLFEAYVEPNAF